MNPHPSVAGVVLTGGASRRMGTDKALLEVRGRALALTVADALSGAGCRPVWCQGGDESALRALGLDVVPDELPGEGPLVATLAALRRSDGEIVVAACDLPELDVAAVEAVLAPSLADRDVAVAVAGGRRHLLARWSATAAASVGELVDGGVRSYMAALDRLRVVQVIVDPAAVRNLNEPGQAAEYR